MTEREQLALARALRSMRPAPRLTVHEWAESERIVPAGTSPAAGRWRSRVYQREVLEAITDPANQDGVLYVGASQRGGKTELLLNTIGYFIASDPSPQILVTYSVDMAAKLSKHRVAPMIRETPVLCDRVADVRSRDSSNTILDKEYDGGQVTFVGANSAGGLSMAPKRIALFDEIDRYPASAGGEGDPIALALMRTEAYWNAVKVYVTSPGIRDISRSWRLWQQSDQREWHVDCPECEFTQVLDWSQVQWEKGPNGEHLAETAIYACVKCGAAWEDLERWQACESGRYMATADHHGLAGFRISALAIGGVPLENIVRKWLAALGNPEELKVFKTTTLSQWWDEDYTAVDHTGLLGRREPMSEREGRIELPEPAAILTAGADVQDNRIEVSIYAWGRDEESWCLGHETIYGDPSLLTTWDALDAFLLRPWPRALGGLDFIRATCVDTGGHHTQAAYDYCTPRFRRPTPDGGQAFVFAIKGQTGTGDLWPRQASKQTAKTILFPIRVDAGKEQVYGRLGIAKAGPGYVHFPSTLPPSFFEQLTAERVVTTINKKGHRVRVWQLKQPGGRNEALDCAVYAYAALLGLRANGFDLDREVAGIPNRPAFIPNAPPPPPKVLGPPTATPRPEPPGRSGWLGDSRRTRRNWLGR